MTAKVMVSAAPESVSGQRQAPGPLAVQPPALEKPQAPKLQEARPGSSLEILLKVEAEARRVSTTKELGFLIANETMKLSRARQIFVVQGNSPQRMQVTCVSSVSQFDRKSAQLVWIESVIKALDKDVGLARRREFELPAYTPKGDDYHVAYPFKNMMWVPFLMRDGKAFGGMLAARDTAWAESDNLVMQRLGETFSHAWLALERPLQFRTRTRIRPLAIGITTVALLCLAGFYPVPLAVLAPMEVSSLNSKSVTAPLDGVVESLLVDANTKVTAGTPVVKMSDTSLRNEAAIAAGEYDKSLAHLKRVTQAAIQNPDMLREIAIARSEAEVARARLDYANELLGRAIVKAPADGVAVYTDKRDWAGKPVQTGERILDIADPASPDLRIFIPVKDAIAVQQGTKVRAFLDSNPLQPLDATVTNASYEARPQPNGDLAYQVSANFEGEVPKGLRLGVHGTAQVLGSDVPLAFYLFRKPFTVIRQWLGM